MEAMEKIHFNTSNVTVHRTVINTVANDYTNFNTSNVTVHPEINLHNDAFIRFQYIQCYGSSIAQ
mgnify:CR=1 FL=1